ncbi:MULTISPECIES: phosphoadenosine phosphosulfate reductase family protein [unclassified Enterococcus]|uniref:phosphoadenosine phosphosulfate reductase domain-containing protein n=1 Tax=unclassified Enterococcus TaxID=2608891 RepID=UPI001555CA90|nr:MULTISPECIES: phosphoadenosine phosphosulfate reductase family protein [unclassified Enterococcus]MBS7576398.1 phosphoadenosine phosphosulfate reductase family protein [Enterococcus sp. MMGLQ5-2]MBS7583630.1 phosphoadenosine phosphosulfate reductase family protein [Enterococcus sp. MMGLQ5-1]NPD11491.1 phosphoadenosine phosphosulfate reductase family protein [Enterococcus sp. MMGLQ5-1]NPD36235.1 phosphoadenosine phosphosulfate reductase family protein [Enterococcus sp. MMGLQ5-2]
MSINLQEINQRDSQGIIEQLLQLKQRSICTTNFRPFEAVLIHSLVQYEPKLPIIWMDSGYNTKETYVFADKLTQKLNLNLTIYHPQVSKAHYQAIHGEQLPVIDTPEHDQFTQLVKIEPFERALTEQKPEIWWTALRAEDSAVRANMKKVAINQDGLIKAAPLLEWTSQDMWQYLQAHDLPNNDHYFDPTKVNEKRECGLHLKH